MDFRASVVGPQYLNCLEAMMEYAIIKLKESDNYYTLIKILFQKYHAILMELKKLNDKKPSKKKSNEPTVFDEAKKVAMKVENILDSKTILEFLKLVFE